MAEIRVKDEGGVVRTLTGMRVKDDGGVVRDPHTIMVKDEGGVVRTIAFTLITMTPTPSWDMSEGENPTSIVTLQVMNDRVMNFRDTFGNVDLTEIWLDVAGSVSDYEVEVTWTFAPISGPSGFQDLTNSFEWVWSVSDPGFESFSGTIEIRHKVNTSDSVTKPWTAILAP